jgi:VanZ family protein
VSVIPENSYRKTYGAAALGWAGFITYGSLVPFTLRDAPMSFQGISADDPVVALAHLGGLDWVTNILIGILLAYLLMGTLGATTGRRAGPVIATLLLCLSLSFCVEFAQTFVGGRVPSMGDVIAQSVGAIIGLAAWVLLGRRLTRMIAISAAGGDGALRAALLLMVFGYVGYALFPFGIILPGRGVLAHFNHPGTFSLWPDDSAMGLRFILLSLVKSLVLMPLGALVALNPHRPAKDGLVQAIALGLLLSAFLMMCRVFFLWSGTDTVFSGLLRAAGAPMGYLVWRGLQRIDLEGLRRILRPTALIALPLYVAGLAGIRGIVGGASPDAEKIRVILEQLNWLPFYYDFAASSIRAVASVGAVLVQYGILGVLLALVLGRRHAPFLIVCLSILIAMSLQIAALLLAGLRPDPSNPILAAMGALTGAAVVPWFFKAMAAHMEEVNRARPRQAAPATARATP